MLSLVWQMFSIKFIKDSDKIPKSTTSQSVIGVEMQISGNIKCSGNLVLKGKVKGNIECDHINISSEGNSKETSNL